MVGPVHTCLHHVAEEVPPVAVIPVADHVTELVSRDGVIAAAAVPVT